MKNLLLFGTLIYSILSCSQDEEISDISLVDQEALIGLSEAYNNANLYNDSLANYIESLTYPLMSMQNHYDEWYHFHDSLYRVHHNSYSHENNEDDHFMDGMGMMIRNSNTHKDDHGDIQYFHLMEDHERIDFMHLRHEEYHPEN